MDMFPTLVNKLNVGLAQLNAKAIASLASLRLTESVSRIWGFAHPVANKQPLPKTAYEKLFEWAQSPVVLSNWLLFSTTLIVFLASLHYVYLLSGNFGPAVRGKLSESE